jgi:putative PIN family toxin of toxin-antitoxin system
VRIFLDTNVLVSAFVSRGLCTDLLKIVLGEHELLVSNLVVEELEGVLREKLRAPKAVLERALSILDHVENVPDPTSVPKELGVDEDDASILAAAIEAEADIFVTGDQELLAAAKGRPLPAVSPRGFMELMRVPRESYPDGSDGDGEPRVSERASGDVGEKAFEFALTIIALCKTLDEARESVLARRLLRAGTSIGASLEEADAAESRGVFDRRMAIASKEARETNYWLRLLSQSGIAPEINFEPYLEKCLELLRLLAAVRAKGG